MTEKQQKALLIFNYWSGHYAQCQKVFEGDVNPERSMTVASLACSMCMAVACDEFTPEATKNDGLG